MNQAHQLPRVPIHDLTHWSDYVPSELSDKNAKALRDYYDRVNKNGDLTDTLEYTKRFLYGVAAKQWMLGK